LHFSVQENEFNQKIPDIFLLHTYTVQNYQWRGRGAIRAQPPPLESVKFMVSRGFQALQDKYTFCFD